MNPYLIPLVFVATLAALIFIDRLYRKAQLYRSLWLAMGKRWEDARNEAAEQFSNAQLTSIANAKLRGEVTRLYAERDALLNGDRSTAPKAKEMSE